MDFSCCDENPKILQLQKWSSTERQLLENLSDYREGFISPSRELLLLHSYSSEALLIPLAKAQSRNSGDPENCNLGNFDLSIPADSSSNLFNSRERDSKEVSTSGSTFSSSRFVSDVYSVAWGVCQDDVCNQHGEILFREMLFVLGSGGVTVHAFVSSQTSEALRQVQEDSNGRGMWVDWGPSMDVSLEKGDGVNFNLLFEQFEDIYIARRDHERDRRHHYCAEEAQKTISKLDAPKSWLHTFLSKVETVKSDGHLYSKFPERPSFPSSAKIVSFKLFGDSLLLDLLSHVSPVLHEKETTCQLNLDFVYSNSTTPTTSPLRMEANDSGTQVSYNCFCVFSSDTHYLVGFALELIEPLPYRRKGNIVVALAKIVGWAMQWVTLVWPDEISDRGEWTDFKLSDTLLICLKASGMISLYDSLSGGCMLSVDLSNVCGFVHCVKSLKPKESGGQYKKHVIQQGEQNLPRDVASNYACNRRFVRLMMASHSSLLGVIDEFGVIYMMHVDDHTRKLDYFAKPFPCYRQLGNGLFIGWEAGGAGIGCQMASEGQNADVSRNLSPPANIMCEELHHSLKSGLGQHISPFGSDISGFSSAVPAQQKTLLSSELPSHFMRRVFLPAYKSNADDVVCFSPFGITRLIRSSNSHENWMCQIVHSNLFVNFAVNDDTDYIKNGWEACVDEAIGCNFQGCLYLVTKEGFSVVLPAIAVSTGFFPLETLGYRQLSLSCRLEPQAVDISGVERFVKHWSPWKLEVLDRVLSLESPEDVDRLCLNNGLDLRISRIRRLQLALYHLKFEEIENSLQMLADMNLAEEGILRLIFGAVYIMLQVNKDVSAAFWLLTIAASFAKPRLSWRREDAAESWSFGEIQNYSFPSHAMDNVDLGLSRRMHGMADFHGIIRKVQLQLGIKLKCPAHCLVDGASTRSSSTGMLEDHTVVPGLPVDIDISQECVISPSKAKSGDVENRALIPTETSNHEASSLASTTPRGFGEPISHIKTMAYIFPCSGSYKLEHKNIVKDAFLSGRLPLANAKQRFQSRHSISEQGNGDIFIEVSDVARAVVYELIVKGETALAVASLQKFGKDIELTLKALLFGTLERSFRWKIAELLEVLGYLGIQEWKVLETLSMIERVYPLSSFQNALCARLPELKQESNQCMPVEVKMHLIHPLYKDLCMDCGEVDGVVFGLRAHVIERSLPPDVEEDNFDGGYWTSAAIWSDAWDQTIIDRVVLDQPSFVGVDASWESRLEYSICHNDWLEVSKLLDVIPLHAVCSGSLSIKLDSACFASAVRGGDIPLNENYTCSMEDLDAVCLSVPNITISRLSSHNLCSLLLKTQMEQKLAEKLIFLKDHWEGTTEMVPLLARSGFMCNTLCNTLVLQESSESSSNMVLFTNDGMRADAVLAFHKLVVHYCAQYNLLNLLDLYLDYHKLAVDQDSLSLLQDAAGNNQWAMWLLLLRVKGKEYEASFCNARAVVSCNVVPGSNIFVPEIDDIIRSVDDIAEKAGALAALATLMFSPVRVEECLKAGGNNRQCNSAQCTLENLWSALQRFPTLGRSLRAACLGHDATTFKSLPKPRVPAYSDFLDYLNWRETIFFSCSLDTSLLQMLPCWFPKAVRRLVQLYVQGPLGWQSPADLSGKELSQLSKYDYATHSEVHDRITAVSWEALIQRHVEEELHASSLGVNDLGLEYHLHRGRALAAFSYFLASRVENFKTRNTHTEKSGSSMHVDQNVQADSLALFAPICQSEESVISKVIFLAITHFEDSVLVAACATLLELFGLSASILQVDIAALRRISSFYSSDDDETHLKSSPRGFVLNMTSAEEGDITESLSRALADYYVLHGYSSCLNQRGLQENIPSKQPPSVLLLLLHHLEKACLRFCVDGFTCGSWLATGKGDGAELRSQQKAASQKWNLVTTFSQIHQMPLSTKYLAYLARDNDWVGFLSEAQLGGYPLETVIEVASKEFGNLPLKIHLLTVLKSMISREQVGAASNPDTAGKQHETSILDGNLYASVELFEIIAQCEKLKNPGEVLLLKAKYLHWPILAMAAACFPDVSALSCLAVWLEITAARETSAIKSNDVASLIANNVGSAVEATNSLPVDASAVRFHYNRRSLKRRRLFESTSTVHSSVAAVIPTALQFGHVTAIEQVERTVEDFEVSSNSEEASQSLSRILAKLCEQNIFLPLLKAFEIFLPSCSLLPFIRALQAFSQMRLSDASAHMRSFSARIQEENSHAHTNSVREGPAGKSEMCSIAVKAADAVLSTCPSPYEKRCLLHLLADANFGDGGTAATHYRQLYSKINLAEPSLHKDDNLQIRTENLDDASLLDELIKNACWEHARTWARQLEASGGTWRAADYITEMQAESMVSEWKEFLWDVPEERMVLWGHCQSLFVRYSFPASQAGLFFLKHAEASEKDLPAGELHELLLLSLQWLSGMITQSNPVSPLNFLREIEMKVWLLAVETDSQLKSEGESWLSNFSQEPGSLKSSSILDHTMTIISKMDNHINSRINTLERSDLRENIQTRLKTPQVPDSYPSAVKEGSSRARRRAKGFLSSRRSSIGTLIKNSESECLVLPDNLGDDISVVVKEENFKSEGSFPLLEERPVDAETAILSLLEFGQVAAARQLRNKLSQAHVADELMAIDAAMKLASISTPNSKVSAAWLDGDVRSVIEAHGLLDESRVIEPLQVLENLAACFAEGIGSALCRRIIAVVKDANVLGLSFEEAFDKQPIELLQLLTLKAQDSFEEANLLVQAHCMPASSIAQVLAESFLKGLLAAHRGGYVDFQKDEGPSPLLWRFSDFLKWAELCPSEPQIGHSLMRLVITGQDIPNACEVELLILAHHFYKSSACLDGVDVLVALAGTRVEAYIAEGDFACLARLITGVGNFHALKFILDILIENGQLDLLLQKYSAAAHSNAGTAETVRGFRMAVLTSLQQFNPNDIDAFSMVYNHFDMKHEAAALLESCANQSSHSWFLRHYKDQTDDLLESMRYFIEAAQVYSSIDAGNKTRKACAQASLVSLQIRMPDLQWVNLSETNARRVLVEQTRFQEALIVAEAYGLNQPSEWALVLWNQMITPESTEQFLSEFEAVLPLHPSMLIELAKFYRAEVAARGDHQSNFSVWLSGGGLPSEWAKNRSKSFRCLFKRTRDVGLRLRLATLATGFDAIVDSCNRILDKVPENAGPLVLKKGHGGAYLPLM